MTFLSLISLVSTVAVLCSTLVVAAVFFHLPSASKAGKGSVQVVVLGDIGHSPRMQYHALSIANNKGHVELIGYLDSKPISELHNHPAVNLIALSSTPTVLQSRNKFFFLLTAPCKVLHQIWMLWNALACQSPACEWMLVQNPPSIPSLILAIVVCRVRNTKLVVDWHNFGYSILALKLGNEHVLVKLAKTYEQQLANFAHCHFTVTHAMRHVLKAEFGITGPIFTLHDRPAPIFKPLSQEQRTAFLTNSILTAVEAQDLLNSKTKLVVSSTSWTADEDFSVLLEALSIYSASAISDSPQLPELLVIITGKGPLQLHYKEKIRQLEAKQELEMITIKMDWLTYEDYASLLGAADLGVSLHTSSSGVDLPMKVVDMFGAGLPVLGYNNFAAWPELVQENVNGKGFSNSIQMSDSLKNLLDPASKSLLILRQGALQESKRRWNSEWNPIAGRVFGLIA